MQFAAARDFKNIGVVGVQHFQRDVAHQLTLQAFTDLAAGDEFAFASGQWRCIDLKIHGERGFIHFQQWQRLGFFNIGNGDADADIFDTVNQYDIAGLGFLCYGSVQSFKYQHLT